MHKKNPVSLFHIINHDVHLRHDLMLGSLPNFIFFFTYFPFFFKKKKRDTQRVWVLPPTSWTRALHTDPWSIKPNKNGFLLSFKSDVVETLGILCKGLLNSRLGWFWDGMICRRTHRSSLQLLGRTNAGRDIDGWHIRTSSCHSMRIQSRSSSRLFLSESINFHFIIFLLIESMWSHSFSTRIDYFPISVHLLYMHHFCFFFFNIKIPTPLFFIEMWSLLICLFCRYLKKQKNRNFIEEVDTGSFKTLFLSALQSLVIRLNGGRYWTLSLDDWSTPFPSKQFIDFVFVFF